MANTILSVSDYKKLRGIADTSRDGALAIALPAAEDAIERHCDRDFRSSTATATREYGYQGGYLPTDDFVSVSAVSIDGRALSSAYYRASPAGPWGVYFGLEIAGRGPSPLMGFESNLDTLAGRGFSTVSVTASWGWPEALPESLKLAVAALTDELVPAAGDGSDSGLAAQSIESYSVVYDTPQSTNEDARMPPLVATLLQPFARVRF